MDHQELFLYLKRFGKDPSALVFEDELTGIYNRRFLLNYLQYKVTWDDLADHPVSLLMMDIDFFKRVNDTYGHDTGDRAIAHVARLLKAVSAGDGLPIRYGGDEFMILLPGQNKEQALKIGEGLVQKIHETPLRMQERDADLFLTLSIGVAAAPGDAVDGKSLMQKADTALYQAKRLGKDCVADVAKAVAEDVFPKIAVQSMENAKMAGRETQLAQVASALKKFNKRKSQILVVEGSDGMGKSSFLKLVQKNLEGSAIVKVKVSGVPEELFRPYYLVSNLLVELLNHREDHGKSVLDLLNPEDVESLSFVLPSLTSGKNRIPKDPKSQRKNIFQSLLRFIDHLVESRPFMVFVDDLNFADEASLQLFRALMLRTESPLFLCCASPDFPQEQVEISPLQRFWQAYGEELELQKIILTPLSEHDIATHLEGIFPSLSVPANFEKELYKVTGGNPLFISEILSKLIHDRKIILTGQQWTIPHLDPAYLPTSLDGIIAEKIVSLDEETKSILNHASIFGESVSLSMLTGSFEGMETRVQDFVDQAKARGLVNSDFYADDETIRFLSKQVREIVYGSIQEDQRENLHGKIALYQEKLFKKRLLPSATLLAWHFKRSANPERAIMYEKQNQEYNRAVFRVDEAADYSSENDAAIGELPLDEEARKELPLFFRSLLTTVRGTKLYPAGSRGRTDALCQLKAVLDRILARCDRVRVSADRNALSVNGEVVDTTDAKSIVESIRSLLVGIDIASLAISRDFRERDLEIMSEVIGSGDRRKIRPRFWEEVCRRQGLESIELKQIRYTRVEEDGEPEGDSVAAAPAAEQTSLPDVHGTDHGLAAEALAAIPSVIGSFMSALSKMKLYPMGSSVMTDAIDTVMAALEVFFATAPVLTLTAVDRSILANGVKIDTKNFEAPAAGFLAFLQSAHLNSVTFMKSVTSDEVASLLKTVLQQPESELSADFWWSLAEKGVFQGILFNRSLYTVFEETSARVAADESSAEGNSVEEVNLASFTDTAVPGRGIAYTPKDSSGSDLTVRLRDLFLCGEEKEFSRLLKITFQDYAALPVPSRENLVALSERIADPAEFVPPPRFLKLLAEHLFPVFREEAEPTLWERWSCLLQQIAFSFLQDGEYPLASWVFLILKERLQELRTAAESGDQDLIEALRKPLPPPILDVLRSDLKSSDLALQQQAMLFLSTTDDRVLPFLITLTKQEDDLRIRQLTAALIGRMGSDAVEGFKRDLVLEIAAEERVRMLDIADLVSRDIHNELSFALEDEKPQVRRAAFRLAERLNDEQTVDLLCEMVRTESPHNATPAIRLLGKIGAAQAVPALIAALNETKEQAIQIACCQALGQIADPSGMEPLIRIVKPRGLMSLQKKYSESLRATAAFALTQIIQPRVREMMKSLTEDSNLRVRRTATAFLARESGSATLDRVPDHSL